MGRQHRRSTRLAIWRVSDDSSGQLSTLPDTNLCWQPFPVRSAFHKCVNGVYRRFACFLQTLPFLSELLEDPEVSVESRAQQVLASLEEIGGEKLDQYLKT